MFIRERPQNYEVISPCDRYKARVLFGTEMPSAVTSGYGSPYYPTKIYFSTICDVNSESVIFSKDTEKAQVSFSDDGKYIEVTWEIAGCIYASSGTRYFRDVFETSNATWISRESSDFSRDYKTYSNPNLLIRLEPAVEPVADTSASDKSLSIVSWITDYYSKLIRFVFGDRKDK